MGYYSVSEVLKNVLSLIYTKMFFKETRLIRLPIYIRNGKYIDFGEGMTTGYRCRFEVDGNHTEKCIVIGKNVSFGDDVRISCSNYIEIGNNVLVAGKVLIVDNSHGCYSGKKHSNSNQPPNERIIMSSPIVIKDNVWVGEGVVIQQGITIGRGAVIAANSVVTKDVLSDTIVGGIPARPIKKFDQEKKVWLEV